MRRKGVRIPREVWLRSKPVRLINDYVVDDGGNVVLIAEIAEKGLLSRLLKWFSVVPPPRYKKFVLDKMGSKVWLMCNGENTIEDIVKALVKETGLSRRNVELAVYSYLNTLISKGLIAMYTPSNERG